MNLTARDVASLVAEGEGKSLEFKRGLPGDAKVARTLCAFANTRGGLLLIGVGDRGELAGAPRPRETVARLRAVASERLEPPLAVEAGVVALDGKRVVWCSVPLSPARPHERLDEDGARELVVRVGASNRRASGATLNALRAQRARRRARRARATHPALGRGTGAHAAGHGRGLRARTQPRQATRAARLHAARARGEARRARQRSEAELRGALSGVRFKAPDDSAAEGARCPVVGVGEQGRARIARPSRSLASDQGCRGAASPDRALSSSRGPPSPRERAGLRRSRAGRSRARRGLGPR